MPEQLPPAHAPGNQHVAIITGLSGAGKTAASKIFEDLGYTVVDNVPAELLRDLAELVANDPQRYDRVAIVLDVRQGDAPLALAAALGALHGRDIEPQIIFLEASDEVLIRRYSETRHRHPLDDQNDGVASAIARERAMLEDIRETAQATIDTSGLAFKQLRERIIDALGAQPGPDQLSLQVITFGFKHGVPLEADLVFDVRFMENPFYRPELREHSGQTETVRDFVLGQPITREFLQHLGRVLRQRRPGLPRRGQDAAHHRRRLHGWLPSLGGHRRSARRAAGAAGDGPRDRLAPRPRGAPMIEGGQQGRVHRLRRWLRPGVGVKRWLLVMLLGLTILATAGALLIRISSLASPRQPAGPALRAGEPQLPARPAAAPGGHPRWRRHLPLRPVAPAERPAGAVSGTA